MKKILLSLGAVTAVLVGASMFAAFEAHVVNVTARIENALFVPVKEIQFGTVFPQEQLDRFVGVSLSQSFLDEDRVDDVNYIIRQKPKCGLPIPTDDKSSPVLYSDFKPTLHGENGTFTCPDGYVTLPLLCPYLSKHEVTTDGTEGENDGSINSFHGPIANELWTQAVAIAYQVKGRLIKAAGDITDNWKIDLKTPCFTKHCAQDWEKYVTDINPTAIPADYVQPLENQHQIFGCDLWLEVTGISLPGLGCKEELDLMLVLDRSGSIGSTNMATMKTAVDGLVTALAPSTAGVHIGQTSFSDNGTLDLHLSDDQTAILAANDGLVSSGYTNLFEGIDLANGELDNAHGHERPLVADIMIIITDGNPNRPPDDANARALAAAEADAARAAGVEVYVVGIGSVDATYLTNDIADDANHYFAAANFDDLQTVLENIVVCDQVAP